MTKPKKDMKMAINYSVQTIRGTDYIILQNGSDIHQIDMGAISTWGVLLGLTDEAEIVKAIVQDARDPHSQVNWEELYQALDENLLATSISGVPSEYVEELLDDETAPVPDNGRIGKLKTARGKANSVLWENTTEPLDAAALTALTDSIDSEKVKAKRVDFIDQLAPVIEILPSLPSGWNDMAEASNSV